MVAPTALHRPGSSTAAVRQAGGREGDQGRSQREGPRVTSALLLEVRTPTLPGGRDRARGAVGSQLGVCVCR